MTNTKKLSSLRASMAGTVRRMTREAAEDLFRRLENLMYPGSDGNGVTVDQLFRLRAGTGITFDDFIIAPRPLDTPPRIDEIDLTMPFGRHFSILPIIGSPMDRVTEWPMGVQLALNKALGFIHANLPPDEQIRQVRQVKRFQQGFIWEPMCQSPTNAVGDAWRIKHQHGFSTIPITRDGTRLTPCIGMVTKYCIDMETDPNRLLGEVMIPLGKLKTFRREEIRDLDEARRVLQSEPRITKLPILNGDGTIYALINRKNIAGSEDYPDPLVDSNNRLRIGAAVTTFEQDDELVKMLLDAEVDAILIDSSQGSTAHMVRRIRQIRQLNPDITIVAGNVATPGQMTQLVEAGADVIRVGMGPGSICTTQGTIGIGRAQGSAIYYCARSGTVLIIADGGIRNPGDMIKAFFLGAHHIMVGGYIAGCDESPAPEMEYEGRRYKLYRGMGSTGAQRAGLEKRGDSRYSEADSDEIVPQGVEDRPIPAIGSVDRHLRGAVATIKKGLQTIGVRSIPELHDLVRGGVIRAELRSDAAKTEGAPHDLLNLPTKR